LLGNGDLARGGPVVQRLSRALAPSVKEFHLIRFDGFRIMKIAVKITMMIVLSATRQPPPRKFDKRKRY